MTDNPRGINTYVRLLELMSVISEEWGETVKETNNYIFKGWDVEDLDKALEELRDLKSPLAELEAMLELEKKRIALNKDKPHEIMREKTSTK